MSRPTILTPEIQEIIVKALHLGATHRLAGLAAGIGESTFYTWMALGRDTGASPYLEFLNAVKIAEGAGAVECLEKLAVASRDGNWQAAAWVLERRYPAEYGRTVQEHTVKVDWASLTEEQLQRLAAGEPPRKVLGE